MFSAKWQALLLLSILSIEFKYRRHKAHPKLICVILLMDQSLENEGILSSLSSFTN